jgi:SNF2 family DNA or RNA helicase
MMSGLGLHHSIGGRVLLFCTFKIMLDILEDYFDYRGWKYLRFDGTTSQRDRTWMIDQFNQPGSEEVCYFTALLFPFMICLFIRQSIFMMTIRAGGLGINLQTADTVILYDSDFNPQMDIQAISRCHRIGQKRPVMVYRFVTVRACSLSFKPVCANTAVKVKSIEEGIWARAKRKRLLEKIFIDKVDEKIETADIEQLLRSLVYYHVGFFLPRLMCIAVSLRSFYLRIPILTIVKAKL